MTKQEFIYLLNKWRNNRISEADARLLLDSARSGQYDELLGDLLEGHMMSGDLKELFTMPDKLKSWSKIENQLDDRTVRIVHRVHFLKTAWFRVAVAVILFFAAGTYLFLQSHRSSESRHLISQKSAIPDDVLPGYNRAILTLSDGKKVRLDSTASETINDGTLVITNSEGQLSYKDADVVAMNTMTTPKGGQYKLILLDGTKVWLNAASSITYPTAFKGADRQVSITGEVYFEVNTNKSKPFIVRTPGIPVTVLGTSFNVNSYQDEAGKTSLLTGSIKINNQILKPGQAFVNGKVQPTSTDQDVAWKNGTFNLENKTVEQAMRELARWYDVDVVYERGPVVARISGKMDRKLTLLEALEGMDGVVAKFTLSGKTVHVLPLE